MCIVPTLWADGLRLSVKRPGPAALAADVLCTYGGAFLLVLQALGGPDKVAHATVVARTHPRVKRSGLRFVYSPQKT